MPKNPMKIAISFLMGCCMTLMILGISKSQGDMAFDVCETKQYKKHHIHKKDFSGNGNLDTLYWKNTFDDACLHLDGTPPGEVVSLIRNQVPLMGEFFHGRSNAPKTADIVTVDPKTGNMALWIYDDSTGKSRFQARLYDPKIFKKFGNSQVSLYQADMNNDGTRIMEIIGWWKQSGELKIVSFQNLPGQESTGCLIDEKSINRGVELMINDYNNAGLNDLQFGIIEADAEEDIRTFHTYITSENQFRFIDQEGKEHSPHECPK